MSHVRIHVYTKSNEQHLFSVDRDPETNGPDLRIKDGMVNLIRTQDGVPIWLGSFPMDEIASIGR